MDLIKQPLRRIDPGFFIVILIAFIAIWPFISRSSLPVETDAELHVFRLHELGLLVQGGDLYPRWAPNFYHGYGYPIFNYYAPLTYYVGLIFELWPQFDAVFAVKAVFVIGMLAAALGTYGFVRDNWTRPSAFVAAALYLYAPYVQYIDPHARGVLPETFSLGMFPLALWALDRLRKGGGPWVWFTAVALVTAVILSHNLLGLLFFGLLFGWAIWQLILAFGFHSAYHPKQRIPYLFAALFAGLGIAAFFWLPVYLEREAVNLSTLIGEGNNYDFHTHFLSLREMLSSSERLDWGATEPSFRFNLGVAQWLFALLGMAMLLARRVRDGAHGLFFALVFTTLVFLMLPLSTAVWEAIPVLPFFQFPWRLLGPAAAMCAILGGIGVHGLLTIFEEREVQTTWVTAVCVAIPLLLGLPLSQPAPWEAFGEVNTLRMSLIENTGRWLGTTSTADYVPATVDTTPARKGSVVSGVAEGKPMDRVNYANLPEEATVETEQIRPLHTRYHLYTPRDTRFRLFLFDFPGWEVRIDGDAVETELGRPEGFIVIPVTQGNHVIDVEFGTTPARTTATIITAVSLLFSVLIGWWLWHGRHAVNRSLLPAKTVSSLNKSDKMVALTAVGISLLTILLLEPSGILRYNSANFVAEPAQTDLFADFGEQIALIGYTHETETAVAGDLLSLDLYWQAQDDLDINYQVYLHLLRPDGTLITQSHKLNPGDFPTNRWPRDKYVRDTHYLAIPEDLPPGEYSLATGMWVQDEGWRLPLLQDGTQIGDSFELFHLQVNEP